MSDIVLLAPFTAQSTKHGPVQVLRVSIERVSSCADVTVEVAPLPDETQGSQLAYDQVFLDSVMAQLKNVGGYTGEPFGRAESGMQNANTVVLEPNSSFGRFAATKGWRYTGGMDQWEFINAMRDVPSDWKIEFNGSDGSLWAIPMAPVIEHHARAHAKDFEGNVAQSVLKGTLPLFKNCPVIAVEWSKTGMRWDELAPFVRMLRGGPEPDLAADFKADKCKVRPPRDRGTW